MISRFFCFSSVWGPYYGRKKTNPKWFHLETALPKFNQEITFEIIRYYSEFGLIPNFGGFCNQFRESLTNLGVLSRQSCFFWNRHARPGLGKFSASVRPARRKMAEISNTGHRDAFRELWKNSRVKNLACDQNVGYCKCRRGYMGKWFIFNNYLN